MSKKNFGNHYMQAVYRAIMGNDTALGHQNDEIRAGLLSNGITFKTTGSEGLYFQSESKNTSDEQMAGSLNQDFEVFSKNLNQGILSNLSNGLEGIDSNTDSLTDAQVWAGYFGQFGCATDRNKSIYQEGNLSLNGVSDPSKIYSLEGSLGTDLDISSLNAGVLSYSVEDNINASQFTTLINISLARQEDLVERFFPTVVIDPKESGVKAIVKYTSFTTEWTRDIDDDRRVSEKMERKSIIKNLFNREILGEDRTRVIPFYRSIFDKYLDKSLKYAESITGENITTAPYKFGEKFDILRLSQTDKTLEEGKMDFTDSLLPSMTLSEVFMKININNQEMKFKFDVSSQPGSNFGYIGNGHFKGLQLNFEERPITINFGSETLKQFGGSNIPVEVKTKIEEVLGTQESKMSWSDFRFTYLVSITGNTNIEAAETVLYANKVTLAYITDSNNKELDLSTGLGKALYDVASQVELIAYNLIAYRSNTNLRTKGRMIRTDAYETYLVAPWRGPFQVVGPITRHTGTECDYDHVQSLITAIIAASDIHGVITLEKYADYLRLRAKNPINISNEYEYKFNDQLVNTYYLDKAINLVDHVDSIMSHQRMVDVQSALMNELRLTCLNMLIDSNYLLAYNVIYRQSGQKPTILIGTDPVIKEFLLYGNEGSNIIPGVNFDIVVESSLNPALKGKMYVTLTLGKKIGELSGIQALNFGYRLYSIAVTATINPETSGGKVNMRTLLIPRFKHEPLLPIMIVYTLSGLPESIKKLPILTK